MKALLDLWVSNLRVHTYHLEGYLKHRCLGCSPRASDSSGLVWGREFAFLMSSKWCGCCWSCVKNSFIWNLPLSVTWSVFLEPEIVRPIGNFQNQNLLEKQKFKHLRWFLWWRRLWKRWKGNLHSSPWSSFINEIAKLMKDRGGGNTCLLRNAQNEFRVYLH